jgi:hypothetical protein
MPNPNVRAAILTVRVTIRYYNNLTGFCHRFKQWTDLISSTLISPSIGSLTALKTKPSIELITLRSFQWVQFSKYVHEEDICGAQLIKHPVPVRKKKHPVPYQRWQIGQTSKARSICQIWLGFISHFHDADEGPGLPWRFVANSPLMRQQSRCLASSCVRVVLTAMPCILCLVPGFQLQRASRNTAACILCRVDFAWRDWTWTYIYNLKSSSIYWMGCRKSGFNKNSWTSRSSGGQRRLAWVRPPGPISVIDSEFIVRDLFSKVMCMSLFNV